MFCPKCGKADQKENSFCRSCGIFLPDFDSLKSKEISPQEHLKANNVLNLMTGIASLILATLLYLFIINKETAHPLIYITFGFLIAMFFWQAQIFWRNLLLKKHLPNPNKNESIELLEPVKSRELLNEAEFSNLVSPNVVEFTTQKLKEKVKP